VVVLHFISPTQERGRAANGDEHRGGAPEGGGVTWQHEKGDDLSWADLSWSGVGSWAEHLEHGSASGNSKENRVGLANGFWAKNVKGCRKSF
jgi:hypothetical protein